MWPSQPSEFSVTPPPKFGMVEPQVFRSAFPSTESFSYLKLLSLRTVINLSQESLTRATTGFFGGHAWWAPYRKLHGALWGLYALTADALYLYADTLAGLLFGASMAVTAVA